MIYDAMMANAADGGSLGARMRATIQIDTREPLNYQSPWKVSLTKMLADEALAGRFDCGQWLPFADQLDEHGECDRANYIRATCELMVINPPEPKGSNWKAIRKAMLGDVVERVSRTAMTLFEPGYVKEQMDSERDKKARIAHWEKVQQENLIAYNMRLWLESLYMDGRKKAIATHSPAFVYFDLVRDGKVTIPVPYMTAYLQKKHTDMGLRGLDYLAYCEPLLRYVMIGNEFNDNSLIYNPRSSYLRVIGVRYRSPLYEGDWKKLAEGINRYYHPRFHGKYQTRERVYPRMTAGERARYTLIPNLATTMAAETAYSYSDGYEIDVAINSSSEKRFRGVE